MLGIRLPLHVVDPGLHIGLQGGAGGADREDAGLARQVAHQGGTALPHHGQPDVGF